MVCKSNLQTSSNETAAAATAAGYADLTSMSSKLLCNAIMRNSPNEETSTKLEDLLKSSKSYSDVLLGLSESQLSKVAPSDSTTRQRHEQVLEKFFSKIKPLFNKTVVHNNPREGHDLFLESLSSIENRLNENRGPLNLFGGSEPNFLDFGIFPYMDKVGKWIPELEKTEFPRLRFWRETMVRKLRDVECYGMTSPVSSDEEQLQKAFYVKELQQRSLTPGGNSGAN